MFGCLVWTVYSVVWIAATMAWGNAAFIVGLVGMILPSALVYLVRFINETLDD